MMQVVDNTYSAPQRRKNSYIEVVSAMIVENNRVLLTQRSDAKPYPGWWEFPGGKVEPGETHFVAVQREVVEETGLFVRVVNPKPVWVNIVENFRVSIYLCEQQMNNQHITLSVDAVKGAGWFLSEELASLKVMPSMNIPDIVTEMGRVEKRYSLKWNL